MVNSIRFKVSYGGQTEYYINGRLYAVRTALFTSQWAEHALPLGLATVGTVMCADHENWHAFPPQDVLDMFPAYVGARYVKGATPEAEWTVEYESPRLYPRCLECYIGETYASSEVTMAGWETAHRHLTGHR